MNAILVPVGSSGDVHPFIGLGLALKKRGHRVTVAVNDYFQGIVERAGLGFRKMGDAADYLRLADNPDIWHPRRAMPILMKQGILPLERPVFELIRELYEPGKTVVVAGSLAFGARVAQEKLGVPLAMVHLQPIMIWSESEPPHFPGAGFLRALPRPGVRGMYWIMNRVCDALVGPETNRFRAALGLPPARDLMSRWVHSPQLTLGFFPEWFAAPRADWPPNFHAVGFPLFDGEGVERTSADIDEFLKEGPPPVVFTAGSAMKVGHGFFRAAAEACRRGGFRGALLTRFAEQVPSELPPGVRHFAYAPFGALFRRAAAVVHHGGIGTTAQALRAGCPQIVGALSHDQFDNGDRVEKLGVGISLRHGRRAAADLERSIARLLSTPGLKERCTRVASRVEGAAALETAGALIEKLL